jgi:WD40 repeat protein
MGENLTIWSHTATQTLSVACDDGRIRLINAHTGEVSAELMGHDDAVQAVAWDHANGYLVSGGSDHTFRVWA